MTRVDACKCKSQWRGKRVYAYIYDIYLTNIYDIYIYLYIYVQLALRIRGCLRVTVSRSVYACPCGMT
ncbi:hypothetical protein WN48_05071 [Eufriesea mexicana]|nr:hypothetical protein WN48_05071 [Eufriesea mexicana]